MAQQPQIKIAATYMRGGTSKGVFFNLEDLPEAAQLPGAARDALLLRVIGSPDPYGKQIDGMGGATSSTSKSVILSRSIKPEHDVDYLFGQVAIDKALEFTPIGFGRVVGFAHKADRHTGLLGQPGQFHRAGIERIACAPGRGHRPAEHLGVASHGARVRHHTQTAVLLQLRDHRVGKADGVDGAGGAAASSRGRSRSRSRSPKPDGGACLPGSFKVLAPKGIVFRPAPAMPAVAATFTAGLPPGWA